jgi:iron complex transport system ATP-binding protein
MEKLPFFDLDSVGYEQQGVRILSDISWAVDDGQHWVVLGPNGSGKSTLLRIATGYLWHTSGRVRRQGTNLMDLGTFRREIGWNSSDILSLIPDSEIALETVVSGKFAQFGLRYLQCTTPTSEDFERASHELQRIGCEQLTRKRFGVLSQGERQQVLIARTRMARTTLLVLDEPCAGMDPGVRERFLAWLDGQLADPTFPTVLFSSHHVEEVMPGFKHALIMADGRIQSLGNLDDVITKANLESVYKTPIHEIRQHEGRQWPIWKTSSDHY